MSALNVLPALRSEYSKLICVWPGDETLNDYSEPGLVAMIDRLDRAAQRERALLTSNTWSASVPRHDTLCRAYKAECAALAEMRATERQDLETRCRQAAYDELGPVDDEMLALIDRVVSKTLDAIAGKVS